MTEGLALMAIDDGNSYLGGVAKNDPSLAGAYTARTPIPTVDEPANLHAKNVPSAECRTGTHKKQKNTGKGSSGIKGKFLAANGTRMQTSHFGDFRK